MGEAVRSLGYRWGTAPASLPSRFAGRRGSQLPGVPSPPQRMRACSPGRPTVWPQTYTGRPRKRMTAVRICGWRSSRGRFPVPRRWTAQYPQDRCGRVPHEHHAADWCARARGTGVPVGVLRAPLVADGQTVA